MSTYTFGWWDYVEGAQPAMVNRFSDAEIANFEGRIIATCLDTIAHLACKTPGYNHKWLAFMAIDELMREIGAPVPS